MTSGLRTQVPEPARFPRDLVRDALADRPNAAAHFDLILAWEDTMLAFCNDVAARADELEEIGSVLVPHVILACALTATDGIPIPPRIREVIDRWNSLHDEDAPGV